MKKVIALLLVVLMVFFTACSAGTEKPAEDKAPAANNSANAPAKEEKPAEAPMSERVVVMLQEGGLGDLGWNDNAWAGAQWCANEYGITVEHVEASGAADAELFVRELAEQGYGLILVMDTAIFDQIKAVAPDYPESIFVVFGRYDMYKNTDNLIYQWFTLNQHAFLAGAAAAYVATDGNEIVDYAGQNPGCNLGLIFPVESNGFYRYGGGYQHGAAITNPDAKFFIDYSTGFSDVALCQTIAENMILTNKCDVIWTCCGTSGLGGLQACRINGALGIGVDTNQDEVEKGYILTSALRRTDNTVIDLIEQWRAGTLRGANPVYNLSNGGLDITDMATIAGYVTNQENFEGLKAHIADIRAKVAAGEIMPYDTQEGLYTGDGTMVTFDQWWAENKDTNPNAIRDWKFEELLVDAP